MGHLQKRYLSELFLIDVTYLKEMRREKEILSKQHLQQIWAPVDGCTNDDWHLQAFI